jgi:methionyl-tRNA formyltransferase
MACCAFHRPCYGFQSKVLRNSHVLWQTSKKYLSASSSSSNLVNDDNNVKARIVFLGTPDVAATSLETIYQSSQHPDSLYKLVGVVTQPPKRRKRGGKEMPSPVGIVAEKLGLRVLCPEKARDVDFLNELEYEIQPDLCITAAYGQYLPKRFLSLPRFGTLNIHPSLLPRWRGSSPVQRSLEAGDTTVGVSVLFTVSKMDAGPIVTQESMDIDTNEQATTLLPKLFDIGTARLIEALPKVISGEITMDTATSQDETFVCEAKMIDSSEGQLWPMNMTAIQCHNRVRGFSMWPGTFIYVRIGDDKSNDNVSQNNNEASVKMKVIETKVLDETMTELTNIIEIGPKKGDGLRLVCFDGSVLELLKVQPVTRNIMDAKSFVNGLQGQTVRWLSGLEVDNMTVDSLIQLKQ